MLCVWKLDRLGRSTRRVLAVVDELNSRGVSFRSITDGLHTEGAMGRAMLTIMAAFAELGSATRLSSTPVPVSLLQPRTVARAGALARSTTPLPPRLRSMREKGIDATDIANMLGGSRATVYRYVVEFNLPG